MTILDGQTVVITGASAGLGRSFAPVLASGGAKAVFVALRADALEGVD